MLNALKPVARFMQCNFKMDRCKFHSIGFVGFVTKQMHTSRFLTEFTSYSKIPCNSLPCWVISWPDEVHHLFPCSHQNPRITNRNLQHWTITNWMAEVKCHSEPAGLNYERHQDILPWNSLSFLIQNIKKRRLSILFSFPVNSINCTTTKKESRLYINFDYVFLLPINRLV